MAGYTRQSAADIVPTAVVRSAPVNAEFNALRDAFSASTGHKHDGTAAEGPYIPVIADSDGNNKIVINTSSNRAEVFVEVSSTPVAQVYFQDGVIVPVTDNDVDLGTTVLEFKNLYLDGTAKIDTLTVDENATIAGTLGVTGLSTLPTVNVDGGTIDSTVIGGTTPAAVTATNLTATVGISGTLTGNVTGNLTGNVTGAVTGNVTGDLTGNVTAGSGSSTFNNVTINGSLDMNSGSAGTITGLSTPSGATDAATKGYVDTSISNLIDSAPGTLDTLNEIAAALGDDPNFATTITNSIATKLPLAGGTMSGAIAMGTNKITGLGDPTASQDAATKAYTDTQDATKLSLAGGTMTGNIVMGANKVTSTATPTTDDDLTRKAYVDSILGSATSAADSAAAAAISETNAATSESNAATSETNAGNSAIAAAASYDSFDDRYLGPKSSAPTLDNDGDSLLTGALYWDTVSNELFVWDGATWQQGAFTASGFLANLVEDTTPQLGGNLDLNSSDITGTGDINITGSISLSGTVDGRDVATDGSKLDGIEASADVTDATNVEAAGALMRAGGTMTGNLILNTDPTTSLQAATKGYVDTIAAAGIHYHDPVRVESPSALTVTYNNGTAGVGATLTNAGTQAALSIDGVTLSAADRVLIYVQTDATQNGVYTVTDVGSGSTNWVLTRATDADSYSPSDPTALGQGDAFFVLEGDTGAGELYVCNTEGTITFGTTDITFAQVASTAVYSAGTGLQLVGTEFSITGAVLVDTDIGASVQAYDADLASWAGVTRAAGFDTFAATPSSSNLASLVTGETGSGALVFGTSPTIATPAISTPTLTGTIIEDVYAITGTLVALEPDNGSVQTHTLSGTTLYTDGFSAGQAITLMIDDGTARTITWPTMTWVNNGGAAPTLATSGYTVVALWKVSTTLYGALVGDGS